MYPSLGRFQLVNAAGATISPPALRLDHLRPPRSSSGLARVKRWPRQRFPMITYTAGQIVSSNTI